MSRTRTETASPNLAAWLTGGDVLSRRVLVAFSLLLLILLVRGTTFATSVVDSDENIFALAAREVVRGHLPYTTFFDVKPVGSTLLIAAAFRIFGQSILILRLIGATCVWASAMLIGRLCRQCGLMPGQAVCASVLYVAFASTMHGLATMTEIMFAPFTIASTVILWQVPEASGFGRRIKLTLCAGLACGAAVLIKIVPLIPGTAVLGLVLLRALWRRDCSFIAAVFLAIVFFLSSAAPMILAGLVYWRSGELAEFMYSNFGFAHSYVAVGGSAKEVARNLVTVIYAVWPLLGLAAISVYGILISWQHARSDVHLLGMTWLGGELVAASLSLHFYPHYFLSALPPLILLAVLGTESLAAWFGPAANPVRVAAVLTALVGLFPLQRTIVDDLPPALSHNDVARKVAALIMQANHGKKPSLFVTTEKFVVLYSLTGSDLPTRYAIPAHLFSEENALIKRDPANVLARVLSHRPDFIVNRTGPDLPSWAVSEMEPVLACCYLKVASLKGLMIYQSRPSASRGHPP